MALTIDTARTIFSDTSAPSPIPIVLEAFKKLGLEDRLALFWFAYTETGKSITPAALGAASMNLIERMLNEIKAMPQNQQTQVMIDIASGADTPISRSYGLFGANIKLGFWYQLAEWMSEGLVAPAPANYEMSKEANQVFETLKKLDGGQQIQVLRDIVVNMGYKGTVTPVVPPKAEEFPFERTQPIITGLSIDGVTDPAPLAYFEAMNRDDFDAAVALFEPNGALQPPFQEPIIGTEAIASYMRTEAQGLNLMPERGITEYSADGSKKLKITGKVQTPWFGVKVAMNIAWRFALTPEGKIFFLAIDMLASPEELLNLRPPSYK